MLEIVKSAGPVCEEGLCRTGFEAGKKFFEADLICVDTNCPLPELRATFGIDAVPYSDDGFQRIVSDVSRNLP